MVVGDLPPEVLVELEKRFEVHEKIGAGGFGVVYRATDRISKQIVAVKVLDPEATGPDLYKEIDFLKKCESEYVIGYKGSEKVADRIWVAMEYCEVGDLETLMEACACTLTEAEIGEIIAQALEGLNYLHSKGRIHRDIKAGNILLNSAGCAKLADLGASAQLTKTVNKRYTFIGTPYWMAPEVLTESSYDTSADIWSLGITAIELAAGEPPNMKMKPMMAIFHIPRNPAPTLPEPTKFSADFNSFIAACLTKDETSRPSAAVLLKHPFIKKFKGKERTAIKKMVRECLPVIKAFRRGGTAEEYKTISYETSTGSRSRGISTIAKSEGTSTFKSTEIMPDFSRDSTTVRLGSGVIGTMTYDPDEMLTLGMTPPLSRVASAKPDFVPKSGTVDEEEPSVKRIAGSAKDLDSASLIIEMRNRIGVDKGFTASLVETLSASDEVMERLIAKVGDTKRGQQAIVDALLAKSEANIYLVDRLCEHKNSRKELYRRLLD